jgi:hypothetical protein
VAKSLVSPAETAKPLNRKPRTLERCTQKRQGPPLVCYRERCIRYRLSEVLRLLTAHDLKPADRLLGPRHGGGNLPTSRAK